MTLVEDWQNILRKAWSVRLILLSAVLSAIEFALPFVAPSQPSGRFAAGAAVISLAAAVARFVSQPKMHE